MQGSMELEEPQQRPARYKRKGGPLRAFGGGDLFTMIVGAGCTLLVCSSIFGLTILLGAYEMSALAGLVFLIMPCVIVGWLAFGPLPCDKDETMRRMKFG